MTKIPNFINSRRQTDAILKMVFIAISQVRIIHFQWDLVCWRRFSFSKRSLDKVSKCANSKWRAAAILKIVYGYISTIYCVINAKFGMRKHDHVWHMTKYQISKILDGGRPPFWKWFYCYVLAADHLISMKFDADANFNTKTRHVTKIKIFQILSTTLAQWETRNSVIFGIVYTLLKE